MRMVGFIPLHGCPSNKKISESESSTGSAITAATTDDGEIDLRGQNSQGHDLLKLDSLVARSTVDTSSGQFSSISDSLARCPGLTQSEGYDPFRFQQSPLVVDATLDLDQLDAGDLFPDDSEDNTPDNFGTLDVRPLLPQHDLDSDAENEANERSYGLPTQTKGMDIRQPSASAYDYFSAITPVSSTTSLLGSGVETPSNPASFVDGSARPALYSAICSLEQASANSFGRIRSQHKASSSRAFDREPALLIPPEGAPPALHSSTTGKPKRSVKIAEHLPKEASRRKEKHSNHPVKSNRKFDENRDVSAGLPDSYEPLVGNPLSQSAGKVPKDLEAGQDAKKKRSQLPRRKLKKVTIKESSKPKEIFRPSSDAYTPRVAKKHLKFKPAEMRTPVQTNDQNMGTLSRPNFRDALKRVAMIIKQHIVKIEERFVGRRGHSNSDGLFRASMLEAFAEDSFATPLYRCTIVRLPMAHPGMVYGLRKVQTHCKIPTEEEIYEFGHQLFKSVQLSSECSIVCLIYIERLMEVAKVPLVARTWRTIFMCGLLLASKVWQDLSSWNIEFATVYPQFSLEAINRLEVQFLKMIKWDLYISSSLYAKYYFALRSILEKQDFRMRYNRMVGGVDSVDASEALKIQQRSEIVKEEVLLQISRSM